MTFDPLLNACQPLSGTLANVTVHGLQLLTRMNANHPPHAEHCALLRVHLPDPQALALTFSSVSARPSAASVFSNLISKYQRCYLGLAV